MSRKSTNTKGKIIRAAWKLFYEQGYENTTVDEIIEASKTSKGSFYHYFSGKDSLPGSLSYLFDEKYEELIEILDPQMDSFDKLMFLNRELFSMIEDSISLDLLARLLSFQVTTNGEKQLLDHNRIYYRLLKSIVSEGQKKGEISDRFTTNEIVKAYAMCERALMYDWCLCKGDYSLRQYSTLMMPMLFDKFRK